MNNKLPPGQHEIHAILRWTIDHPGIIKKNPKFDPVTWKLTIDGEVNKAIKLTWQDFLKLHSIESISDFHCVEGWSVKNCKWYGVQFSTLIPMVNPHKVARYVFFRCSDGYTTSLNLSDILKGNVLLAYKLNGRILEESLGGPLRLIVPEKYSYKSAMWVTRVIFMKRKELGYWEKLGYSDTAYVWKNDRFKKVIKR